MQKAGLSSFYRTPKISEGVVRLVYLSKTSF